MIDSRVWGGLRGVYGAILADPPWRYRTYSDTGRGKCADRHYSTMTLREIMALPVREIAAKDCHLFLWTVSAHIPDALALMEAWGFNYSSTAFIWVKLARRALIGGPDFRLHMGLGKTTRKQAEICLLGRRGSPRRLSASVPEIIMAPVREHSRKPDEARVRIMEYAPGPHLEMFARERAEGWDVWGDEVEKFSTGDA